METKNLNAIQDHYPNEIAWCYGCGRLNKKGHHFRTTWDNGKTLSIFTPKPEHIAVPRFVYGGIIASLIDCHSSGSCSIALLHKNGETIKPGINPPRFVAAMLKVDFLKPTPQNFPLRAIGTVSEIHPKKWKVETEVFANEILCAKGEFIGVVMPKSFLEN